MARSAGGSTGAASLATLDATTSEGDTHLSPMLMRTDGAERLDDDALRTSPERAAATRAAQSSGSAHGMGGAGGAGEARRRGRGTRRGDARRDGGDEDADDDADVERSARDLDDDGGYETRMPAVDAAAVTRSIENPGHATVIGDEGARRAATHSIQNSQAVRSNDDVVNGDEAGNVRARARAMGEEAAATVDATNADGAARRGAAPGLTRSRVGGRGGATGSSSTVHGHAQRPANSAGDSNTAAVSSDRARPVDSTEAQRLTNSRGEGGRADSGLGNSEEVECGDIKAAGSLLAGEGGAAGVGTEVESKQIILPAPTRWDNQEPWDVPRESLVPASLELKARADALKAIENFGTAERAYGHALRFIDQIEMFETEETGGSSERNSQLKTACLLEASACALRRADPVRAGELAARALAREPNNALALKARALAAVTEGDFGTAIGDLTKALEMTPDDPGLVADLREATHRRDVALHAPRRGGIASSFIGAPGGVSWGTMPMSGMAGSSAQGGQLFSYPNAGYVASGGLGMHGEVEGETDGAMSAGVFGGGFSSFQNVDDNAAMDTRAMLDGTHLRRPDSPSHATGTESRMDQPGTTFNRVGGTPSVSKGTTISMQKNAMQSDAFMLGDESEEDGEEVCGGGGKEPVSSE